MWTEIDLVIIVMILADTPRDSHVGSVSPWNSFSWVGGVHQPAPTYRERQGCVHTLTPRSLSTPPPPLVARARFICHCC